MVSREARKKLEDYDYPGNVRELENIIMAAVSMADDEHVLDADAIDLGSEYKGSEPGIGGFAASSSTLAEYLAGIEETVIRRSLVTNEGNVSKTAKELGMLRQNLQHKMRKYGI